MPFYEYQCKACGAHHEAMQKMSDPPLKKCPDCGRSRLVRLVSAPVFRLKGGGWYETDFKSDKESKRNLAADEKAEPAEKSDSADSKSPASTAEATSDKPAAKPVTAAKPSRPAARAAAKPAPKKAAAKRPAKKAARRR